MHVTVQAMGIARNLRACKSCNACGLFCRTTIIIIIIIPLFTLGSIYSTNASGAKQMPETELNRIKNPNWPEVNQLAIYKYGRGLELGLLWTNPATVVVRAALELGGLRIACPVL